MVKKAKAKTKAKTKRLTLAKFAAPVKLDLACGQNPVEGFEGVDLNAPNAKHRVDLMKFPWPWADNSVDEIHCSHFIEHIENRCVEARDLSQHAAPSTRGVRHPDGRQEMLDGDAAKYVGKDMLFAFFDECFRILKPGAKEISPTGMGTPGSLMKIVCPNARSNRAFQDPTHRRFIVAETFLYLWAEWRKANKLDHYNVECDFRANIGHSMADHMAPLSDEVRAQRFNESWNVIGDWIVTLHAAK